MTFTQEIKQELFALEYSKNDFNELLKGLFFTLGKENKFTIRNNELFNFVVKNIQKFEMSEVLIKSKTIFLKSGNFKIKSISWKFVSGIFLATGSVVSPTSSRYHLEIKVKPSEDHLLEVFFDDRDFAFSSFLRQRQVVMYLKKADQISDFLKSIGAWKNVMNFEDERIRRDFNNSMNRISNLDFSNQEKISNHSFELIDAIEQIELADQIDLFSKQEQLFMKLRKQNPYDSMQTLADKMNRRGNSISKSGLNHWTRKIRKFASEL